MPNPRRMALMRGLETAYNRHIANLLRFARPVRLSEILKCLLKTVEAIRKPRFRDLCRLAFRVFRTRVELVGGVLRELRRTFLCRDVEVLPAA